jgi:hydrogenase large subunit
MTQKMIPLNRVEGDLKLHLEIEDNIVRDARSVGTMYRGIENLMTGRGPMDSLVITPRICGICTTAHLNGAAKALDMAYGARVPDNAQRLRNVTLMVEQLQNDIRHAILLFMPDMTHWRYAQQPLHGEAFRRYAVLKGETTLQTVEETKRLLEIIAILGGQWPHSSFMVPGGVVSVPAASDIIHCRHILRNFRKWYEHRILGCTLETFGSISSWSELKAWMVDEPEHHGGDLGFFLRYAFELGLERLGNAHDTFISCGGPDLPSQTAVVPDDERQQYSPSGFYSPNGLRVLDPGKISEDISHAFFRDNAAARHPYQGRTVPLDSDKHSEKYSWAKAPRYGGLPAETGPLADMVVSGHPLFTEQIKNGGANVLIRQLARFIRPAIILPAVDQWLAEMAECKSAFFQAYSKRVTSRGYGLITAPRGILGHWLNIENGQIANYQVITPTAWNPSPKDAKGVRGPWEEALVGTRIEDIEDPLEVEHIIRSFDPCLVCTVHAVKI